MKIISIISKLLANIFVNSKLKLPRILHLRENKSTVSLSISEIHLKERPKKTNNMEDQKILLLLRDLFPTGFYH